MCPQQRPRDVLTWWKACHRHREGKVWLSADYTDFNKEHSLTELQLINYALVEAWLRYARQNNVIGIQKAIAARWVARSLNRRTVLCSDTKEEFRVYSALWSGSRDTARDNTISHQVYYRLMLIFISNRIPSFQEPSAIIHVR